MEAPCRGQWLGSRIQDLRHAFLSDDLESRRRKRKAETSESSLSDSGSHEEAASRPLDLHRQFHASDCMSRLSKRLGVKAEAESCCGTLLPNFVVDRRRLDATRKTLKRELDKSWAKLAVEEGVRLAKDGDYNAAVISYDQAMKLDPRNVDARVARGAAYANQGRYSEALIEFEAALELQPHHKNAREYKERVTVRQRDNEKRQPTITVSTVTPQLSYSHGKRHIIPTSRDGVSLGLFGRGLPLEKVEASRPTEKAIASAMKVLKDNKDRERHRRRRKHRRRL